MLGFVGTVIYDLTHFGNRNLRTAVPPASGASNLVDAGRSSIGAAMLMWKVRDIQSGPRLLRGFDDDEISDEFAASVRLP
jgi:hypothetical protein